MTDHRRAAERPSARSTRSRALLQKPLLITVLLLGLLAPSVCAAQAIEQFYQGKTVSLIIGFPPAGANNHYGRLVAKHIGKHIPGEPGVIARNMPGGGSLVAAGHIFNAAPRDGTVLGLIVPTALPLRSGWVSPACGSGRPSSTGSVV